MDLYGKLNNEIELKEYKAGKTETSDVNINSSVITVDVKKVPNKLEIKYNNKLYVFDGSQYENIDLNDLTTNYAIFTQITDGKYIGMLSIKPTDTISSLVIPNNGYHLPETINVENANVNYNNSTGQLIIDSPNDTVIIEINCQKD